MPVSRHGDRLFADLVRQRVEQHVDGRAARVDFGIAGEPSLRRESPGDGPAEPARRGGTPGSGSVPVDRGGHARAADWSFNQDAKASPKPGLICITIKWEWGNRTGVGRRMVASACGPPVETPMRDQPARGARFSGRPADYAGGGRADSCLTARSRRADG